MNLQQSEIIHVDTLGIRYIQITEEDIIQWRAASEKAGNDVSDFDDLIEKAETYREANLTPIFMHDIEETHFRLGCLETFGKKLH